MDISREDRHLGAAPGIWRHNAEETPKQKYQSKTKYTLHLITASVVFSLSRSKIFYGCPPPIK
jgi:hypothetical protein